MCGRAILKMPVRAEIVTGTVRLVHVLAAAELTSRASIKADMVNMSSFGGQCVWMIDAGSLGGKTGRGLGGKKGMKGMFEG